MDIFSMAVTAGVSCLVTTFIGIAVGTLRERLKNYRTAESALNEGMKYLLKDRINISCEYWLDKGYIPANALKVIHEMASIYYKLGGNDFIEALVDKVDILPSKKQ